MHEGHRQRLKKRFLEEGLDGFTDVQALELLLFYAIPRADTNPAAHALLEHFGSLSQVLEADPGELTKVPGVGESAALLLHLVPQLGRMYMVDRTSAAQVLPTLESCAQYLVPRFFGRKTETVFLLCLDAKCKVISCKKIGEGNVNSTSISVRKVVETALREGASAVVLGHNHPSGIAVPSPEDIETTLRVAEGLNSVDIRLADHIVVADDDYVSMVQSKYLPDIYPFQ